MAVSINDIKHKISATESMSKITKAMQMVSVSKLGKIETRIAHFRDYLSHMKTLLSGVKSSESIFSDPLACGPSNPKEKTGYILITTNRGLVGGYNNNLFKFLKQQLSGDYKLYVTGQKGAVLARSESLEFEEFRFSDEIGYREILPLIDNVISDYLSGEINRVVVLHMNFVSKLVQEPHQKVLLPLDFESIEASKQDFLITPDEYTVVDEILTEYVKANLYEMYLDANMAEHAARMNAMQNATDNADDIIKDSKLIYNRVRQATITQELNEIIAGASAVE